MDLEPSKLGTKDYWQDFYKLEIKNFQENPEDTGECWFNDSGAERQVVDFIADNFVGPEKTILDLGTGNGRLLFSLRDADVEGEMLGIDYVESSVEFASKVAKAEGYDVKFQQADILADEPWTNETYEIVLDKGTLDAIALSGQEFDGVSAPVRYAQKVIPLVKEGGVLIITSCNFTKQELANLIKLPYKALEYPTFNFGGSTGSTVVTLIFQC